MVRFWQAGEDNTKKVDLWMSKLSIKKQNLQPLGATESLATKRAGQLLTTGMQAGTKVSAMQHAPAEITAEDHHRDPLVVCKTHRFYKRAQTQAPGSSELDLHSSLLKHRAPP